MRHLLIGSQVVMEDYPESCFEITGIKRDGQGEYLYDLTDINEIEDDLEDVYDTDFELVDIDEDFEDDD